MRGFTVLGNFYLHAKTQCGEEFLAGEKTPEANT